MRKTNQLVKLGLITVMAGLYSSGASAATVDGDAAALIIAPLQLAEVSSMDFGTLAASGVAGTVVLDLSNGRTAGGGVSLVAGGSEASGQFTIQGEAAQAFTLSVSAAATLENGAGDQMTANGFTENGNAVVLTGGADAFQVGATLNVGVNQPAGAYSTTTGGGSAFTITANYD